MLVLFEFGKKINFFPYGTADILKKLRFGVAGTAVEGWGSGAGDR